MVEVMRRVGTLVAFENAEMPTKTELLLRV